MEMRVLNYFLTVAQVGNITKAASQLHITQPTLSRQLMQLEEDLGVALFVRGKRKMILTEEGLLLKRRAEEILTLTNLTKEELGVKQATIKGTINIGYGLSKATNTFNGLIEGFMSEYNDVTFNMKNGNTHFVLENLENGLIDVGVVLDPVDLEKFSYIHLKEKERWGLIVSNHSHLAKLSYIEPKDLQEIHLIHSPRIELKQKIAAWSKIKYEDMHVIGESEMIVPVLNFIKKNQASAIAIEGAMDSIDKEGICFIPFYPEMVSQSYIVWKKYQSFSLTISKFLDYIQKNS